MKKKTFSVHPKIPVKFHFIVSQFFVKSEKFSFDFSLRTCWVYSPPLLYLSAPSSSSRVTAIAINSSKVKFVITSLIILPYNVFTTNTTARLISTRRARPQLARYRINTKAVTGSVSLRSVSHTSRSNINLALLLSDFPKLNFLIRSLQSPQI